MSDLTTIRHEPQTLSESAVAPPKIPVTVLTGFRRSADGELQLVEMMEALVERHRG